MTKTHKDNYNSWLVLALVMTGVFLSTMDSGMLNVALPTIMRSLQLSLEQAELVVTLYLLTITATLVFWGRLADRLGKGNIYLSGMVTFAVGSLACYLATGYGWLLVSRFIEALGASMMMSSGSAIIKTVFPVDHLGRSLGLVGIATACGLLTGPLVSGLLLSTYSWRSIFLITLPVSIVAVSVGSYLLLDQKSRVNYGVSEPFDWKGSCCWVVMVILGVSAFRRIDRFWTLTNLPLLVGLIAIVYLFVQVEKKSVQPILPIKLFRKRYYWIAVSTVAISFAVLFTVLALIPFYLEYIQRLPVERVGKLMMAVPATIIVLSPCSGWLYDRIGARFLTTVGLAICTAAIVGLGLLSQTSSITEIALKLALLGAGQSIFLSPNSASALSRVSEKYLGITSGILATARNFGMVAGATLAAAFFSWWFSFYSGGGQLGKFSALDSANFILALRSTFLMVAVVAFLGCCISAGRR